MEWPMGVYWGGGCPHRDPGLLHGLQCQEYHPSINRSTITLTTRLLKTEFWWNSIDDPSSSIEASQQDFATWSALGRGARVAVFVCFYSDCVCVRSVFSHKFVLPVWMEFCKFFKINLDPVNKPNINFSLKMLLHSNQIICWPSTWTHCPAWD